ECGVEDYRVCFNGRSALCNGLLNGFEQDSSIKVICAGHHIDVKEVLHPAVCLSQIQHSLEFFRDDGFSGIRPQVDLVHAEQRRIDHALWMRHDDSAKSQIELKDAARTFKKAGQLHANPMIVCTFCNGLRSQRVGIKN